MQKVSETQIRKQLGLLAQKQREAAERFQALIGDPAAGSSEIENLMREQNRLATKQAALMATLSVLKLEAPSKFGAYGMAAGQRPLREQVLDVLEAIGVPASPRLISQFAAARYGVLLPVARFASLRRDEERAYQKDPTGRPSWVVPAINVLGLVAIPRIIATSAWEAERRLIGPRTLRTNHLRALLAMLEGKDDVGSIDKQRAAHLGAFISRYAQSVTGVGALEPGSPADAKRMREVAQTELARIEPADLDERRTAAERLKRLPGSMQLWGAPSIIADAASRAGGHSL